MSVRSRIALLAFAVLAVAGACSSSSSGDDDPAASGDEGSSDNTDQPAGDLELPPELADFPLPDDYFLAFPPTYNSAEADPRETLVVAVNGNGSAVDAVAVISEGLEDAGYQIDSEAAEGGVGQWAFTKDGVTGSVTVGTTPDDLVLININLFMAVPG